jgi:Ni/Fe-hydrogenase subunit HybB-like protein
MSPETRAALNGAGYADQPVTKAPNWHGLVAWDMLFNNLTTGLFFTAALGELLAPQVFLPLVKVAYPLALVLLLIDLVCLVLDLGDPLRFHHMLRVFKPSSPMSLGTWCLTTYSLPLTVAALIGLLQNVGWVIEPPYEWLRKSAVVLGLLPALGSAVYKGVLLSTTSQPGWKDARWMGGYLASAAILLGCAEMLLLALFMGQGSAVVPLRVALVYLLLMNDLFLMLLRAELRPALKRIYGSKQLSQRGTLGVGAAMILPLGLILIGDSASLLFAAVIFLLLGSVAIRFEIIKLPHALTALSTNKLHREEL